MPVAAALATCAAPFALGQEAAPLTVSQLVKTALDSVVLIEVSDAFGHPFASGSGFIISPQGQVVTNHHVIEGARSATVKLNNGATFAAEGILADDSVHDVAVIKVPGRNLPALPLGDSGSISIGDHVVAIGSPLGLANSVSDGIVSAIRDGEKGMQWIQTTAAASHGNSGGPLLTMDGRVVGVLTLKATEGENLNFAVPSKFIPSVPSDPSVKAFGTLPAGDSSTPGVDAKGSVWTSMTSGRDFNIRIDGDYLYAEWANVPADWQQHGAFLRSELRKNGQSWAGKTRMVVPCQYKSSYSEFWTTGQTRGTLNVKWCSLEEDIEIDRLSDNRIEGVSKIPSKLDCRKCQAEKWESKPFSWIPR